VQGKTHKLFGLPKETPAHTSPLLQTARKYNHWFFPIEDFLWKYREPIAWYRWNQFDYM